MLEDAAPSTFTLYEIYVLVSGEYSATITLTAGNAGMFNAGQSPTETSDFEGASEGVIAFGETTLAVRPDMNGEVLTPYHTP